MNQKKIKTNIFLDPYALLALIFIIIRTILVYYQVKKFDFVNLDDQAYVYENIKILEGLTIKNIKWSLTAIVSDNSDPSNFTFTYGRLSLLWAECRQSPHDKCFFS